MHADAYSDGTYKAANPQWGGERSSWKAEQILRLLKRHEVNPASVMEIGCGTGLVLKAVGEGLGDKPILVGVEPSLDAPIDSKVEERVRILHCMPSEIKEKSDLVLLLDVFEHVEDYLGLIREAKSHTNRWIAFHIPLEISVLEVLSGWLGRSYETVFHLHFFSDRTALLALRVAGITNIVDVAYTKSGFEGPTKSPGTPLNRLRRVLFRVSPKWTARLLGGVALAVLAKVDAGEESPAFL